MKYGYIPDFNEDFFSEVSFAIKHFDFLEFTIELDFAQYSEQYLQKIRSLAQGFELIGHLFWGIDLNDTASLDKVKTSIGICKQLGIRKIIAHPSTSASLGIDEVKKNNLAAVSRIMAMCGKDTLLLLENISKAPFCTAAGMAELLGASKNLGLALDIGHANKTSPSELKNFFKLKNRIKHIHLHNQVGVNDHLFFDDEAKLRGVIQEIKRIPYDSTISLEMFNRLVGGKPVLFELDERRRLLLRHLKVLKS